MRKKLLAATLCCLGIIGSAFADPVESTLIFSGSSSETLTLDLSQYNRVYFGEESMTVKHSTITENSVALPYSEYTRFEFGSRSSSAVATATVANDADCICYDRQRQSLRLIVADDAIYSMGIYSMTGTLVASANLRSGEEITVSALPPAIYAAVAVSGNRTITVKFITK